MTRIIQSRFLSHGPLSHHRKVSAVSVALYMIGIVGRAGRVSAMSTTAGATVTRFLRDASLLANVEPDESFFEVYNPADPDMVLSRVPNMDEHDAQKAVDLSATVLPSWRDGTTGKQRSNLLAKWSELVKENANDLATIMTLESGKPLKESLGEVGYGASFLDYYAAEAIRPSSAGGGFMAPSPFQDSTGGPKGKIMAIQEAVGVTAMITPWNFPLAMITRKVGPALAAGCTAVVKPSELTPLTALALKTLADRAGIPRGVLQIVTPDTIHTPEVGTELCTSPLVKKLSFTGSTPVGKLLIKLSSDSVKRLSLELGGNAPFVVFEDADMDEAVSAALASKFRNAGQTCVCADRFLVHSSVHDEFVSKLKERAERLVVGHGNKEGTTMGPLITKQAVENVHAKVQEAVTQHGAKLVMGGTLETTESLGPHFYDPTILTGVSTDSRIWKTETFGPVAAVRTFDTEEEALDIANNVDVGLASYFCTRDMSRIFRFGSKLECGMVGINDGIISTSEAPFGGVKQSGLGREGSHLGIAEYLETKYMFLNV